MNGDMDKAGLYAELSGNKAIVTQITNAVIRKIKDMLLAS